MDISVKNKLELWINEWDDKSQFIYYILLNIDPLVAGAYPHCTSRVAVRQGKEQWGPSRATINGSLDVNAYWRIQAQLRSQEEIVDSIEIQKRIGRRSGAYPRA